MPTPGRPRSSGLDCPAGPVDRLRLHTPKGLSALPGLPMPESWPRYPAREQVIEYLEMYQRHVAIRPHSGRASDLVERGAEVHLAVRSPVNVLPRDICGAVPVPPLGIVMRRLPTLVADALAWPMVRARSAT